MGKTSTSVTSVGIEARNIGLLAVNRDNATPVYFGRQTSYGHLIEFRKETSIVGKLGIEASGFYLDGEASHSGLKFTSAGITPRLNGAGSDNTVNLGESGVRFKDLFLSGKVTAANIYNAAGSEVVDLSNADSTIINDPEGVSGLYIGDSGQPDNYYSNTTHTFTGRNLTDIHAIIDTTGIKTLGDYKVGSTTVIDASRNLTNIGTISSGAITASGNISSSGVSTPEFELVPTGSVGNADIKFDGTSLDIRSNSSGAFLTLQTATTERLKITNTGNFEFNNGNLSEVGTISSGAITSSGSVTGTYFTDGYVTWNAAQFNRSGAYIELQWSPANSSAGVRIGGNTSNPIVFDAYNGTVDAEAYKLNGTTVIDSSRNLENIVNASTSKLTLVANTAANFEITASGTGTSTLYFNMTGGSQAASLSNSGNLIIAGSLTEVSDRRVKDNIAPIPDALSKTCALQGSTYTRTDAGQDTTKVHAGLIAQDVEAVLPEAIGEKEDMKTVNYSSVVALLVESIKELKSEVDDLKTQLSQKEK